MAKMSVKNNMKEKKNNRSGTGKKNSIWDHIIEAIRGGEQDFTRGKIGRAILLLSIPMILEMVMESVFSIVDIFFVSKLGSDAVAAVGITESLLTIVYAVGAGLAISTTAVVARRIGEKDREGAAIAAVQAIVIGLVVSISIGLPALIFSKKLLALMGATSGIIRIGSGYTTLMLGSNVVIMLLFMINAVFRGAGDAAIAMRVLWVSNLINIVLDPCLIFGLGPFPEMGITGAALATTIGRGLGVVYQFSALAKRGRRVRIRRRHLVLDRSVIGNLVGISFGGIGQHIIATTSWIGLMRIMAVFGSHALAGYTIAIRIIMFALLPSWGMSNAAATLVGQNLGARKPDRAQRSVWITGLSNMVFLGVISLVFIFFPEPLMIIFTRDEQVIGIGVDALRVIGFGFPLYALQMVMSQAFNGAGDTRTPTVVNFFCFWLLEIPLAYTLALRMGLREWGIFLAILLAESVAAIASVVLFRQGKWRDKKI
jgi:putative MATE family efflux protein